MATVQKHIIFDLGAVMVDWNPQKIAQQFTTNTQLQHTLVNGVFHHPLWLDFDNGLLTEQALIQHSSDHLSLPLHDIQQLIQQAKESLQAKKEMVGLLKLAKDTGLKTYCLSNLSHDWFAYLSQRHDFFKLFDGKVISAQEGISKPNLDIYQRLIKRYSIDTAHTLFIDDRHENTQAAQSLGIHCVTFEHSPQNLETIRQFILN